MLLAFKIAAGVSLCLVCSAAPWALVSVRSRLMLLVFGIFLIAAAAGAALGLALFPYSNLAVLGVAIGGGVLLGRLLPTRFAPVLLVLLALSVLDAVQVVVFNGPPSSTPSTATATPDPHLIWVNFRLPLPGGHFNIGFADLLLVAALAENFRRRRASWPVAATPGVLALSAGTLIGSTPAAVRFAGGAFSEALVPYLTAGWLLAYAWGRGFLATKSST